MSKQVAMIDVSDNNHYNDQPIAWGEVHAAGYGAVMIKCSEGTAYLNPWRKDDAEAATAAGVGVGFYHFAHPGMNRPDHEALYAVGAIDGLPRIHGLALDLEVTEGQSWRELAHWAQTFLANVREHVDHAPLYVNDYFLTSLQGAPWGHRLWLAQTARPRQQVWAWQQTTPARVAGISVPTDVGWLHPDE